MHGKSVRLCVCVCVCVYPMFIHPRICPLCSSCPSPQTDFLRMSLSLFSVHGWLYFVKHHLPTHPWMAVLGLPFLDVAFGSHSGMLRGRQSRGIFVTCPSHRNCFSSMTSLICLCNTCAKIGYRLLAVGISAFLVNKLTFSMSEYTVAPLSEKEYTSAHLDYNIEAWIAVTYLTGLPTNLLSSVACRRPPVFCVDSSTDCYNICERSKLGPVIRKTNVKETRQESYIFVYLRLCVI
jgi:hypothetical protein